MGTKKLFGVVGILIFIWAGDVLAQSLNQVVNVAREAKTIFDSAKSKADYQRAAQKYEEALKISERVKSDKWIDICSYQLGAIQSKLEHYQKSLEYYEKSLAISRKTKDMEGEGKTLGNIGGVYRSWNRHTKALDYYMQSLIILKKIGDVKAEGRTLVDIGVVCYSLGQYPKALDYLQQALVIRRKTGDVEGEASTLSSIGAVCKSLGQYTKARNYLERSLDLNRNLGAVKSEGVALNNIGSVFSSLGQYPKALDYLQQALVIRRKTGDVGGESATLCNMARINAAAGRYDEAESQFKQCIEIQQKMGFSAQSIEDDLANLYLDINATVKAEPLIYETRHDSSLGRLALIKFDYSSAQKYYEKDALEAEKAGETDTIFRSYTGLATAFESAQNYAMAEQYYEKAVKLVEEISSGLLPSERKNFIEVKIGGFCRSEPAKGLTRVRMKLVKPTDSVNSIGVSKQAIECEQSPVNKLAALKIKCKTKRRTTLILIVIDVGYPKSLHLVKDMTDSDIKYLFESRIKDKNFVWIPENAAIEVTERGKTISMVTFGYSIDGYVMNEDLICDN